MWGFLVSKVELEERDRAIMASRKDSQFRHVRYSVACINIYGLSRKNLTLMSLKQIKKV